MNRIETNYIELYVEGEKSGSRTVTLTCADPIEVTYEQFTNRLNGVVNVSITDNFTTEVKFNISFSDLWVYGETYSGLIHARLSGGADSLDVPVVINCSDTLIYSNVPDDTVIDVEEGIHITYSSVPDVNRVWIVFEDESETDITDLLNGQTIDLTYEYLLSRFGVADYDYICATNGLSQIAHKLKKVVYKLEIIGDSDIYIDYREQWVEFKFLSTRNDEFMTFTYNSAFDGLQYEFDVDDNYVVTMRVKVPANFDKERVIPIAVTQDEFKYIIRFSIIQEKGVLDFKFKSPTPMYIDREEQIIDVKILSFASGEYPSPIIGILPAYMQHISTVLNEEGVYVVKLKIDKNESFKRGGKIQFTQTDFGGVIYLNYSQDGDKFIPDGDGGSEDDEGNVLYGLLGFWGLDKDQYIEQDDDLTEKYSFVQRQYDSDGNEIYVELGSELIKLSGEDCAEIVEWENQYDSEFYYPTEYARGVYTELDLSNISIIPKTKDVGQLLFYRSQLNELNSLDLPLVNTREMFWLSDIKTIGTKDTPLDLNGVEIASGMFNTSHTHTIYINNTHNIKMAPHMFYDCGAGEGIKLNINGEDGVYLDLSGAENIGGLFQQSGYLTELGGDWGLHSVKELKLTKNCKYATAAFSGCYNLIDLPLIDCSGIEDAERFLSGCEALRNVGGFKGFKVDLDLTDCTMLTYESLLNIINNLADVRYLGGRNLSLHENHLNVLSDDELYLAVKKGWIVGGIGLKPISEENECIYIAKESTGNKLYPLGTITSNDTSMIDTFLNDIPYDGYEFDGTAGLRYNYKFKVRGTNYDDLFKDCCLYRVVKLDTSNAYSINGLFSWCKDLISIPEINISNSNSARSMFYGCSALTTIPQLDTSNVTDMEEMFYGCSALTSVPLLDTSKVTNMLQMFYGCSALTTIPQLDTSNIENMGYVFGGCLSLTSIPLLDTSNVTKMHGMFDRCPLTTIPLLNTSKVENMSGMFIFCDSLTTIPQLDTSNVTDMYGMFYNCTSLTTIPLLDTSKVVDVMDMFYNCTSLTTIPQMDASKWDFASNMFDGCTSLTNVGGFVGFGMSLASYLDLSYSTRLTHESLMNIINNLGGIGGTLRLGEINIAKLTYEEIAMVTNRGWNLS